MTHEELLAKIDNLISVDKNYLIAVDKIEPKIINGIEVYWKALRAVVELHKPNRPEDEYPNCEQCQDSESYYDYVPAFYPCPTIQAIEKELL